MSKFGVIRSFVAIATITTLLSTAYRSSAVEFNRLVVVGIPLDRVTNRHSAPACPQEARSLWIQGNIQVDKGKMVNVTAESTSPILASYTSRWILLHWQFRPSASGVYFLPISYKLTS